MQIPPGRRDRIWKKVAVYRLHLSIWPWPLRRIDEAVAAGGAREELS